MFRKTTKRWSQRLSSAAVLTSALAGVLAPSLAQAQENSANGSQKTPSQSARSATRATQAPSRSFSSRGQLSMPPTVPSGSFRYEDIASRANCPVLMQVTDSAQLTNTELNVGEAPLGWVARSFRLVSRSETHATWAADLVEKYQNCEATGYLSSKGRRALSFENSHVRITMEDGKLNLTLELDRLEDDSHMISASVTGGIPTWSWVTVSN